MVLSPLAAAAATIVVDGVDASKETFN